MKTLNEIKDEVAGRAGYKNWDLLMYTFAGFGAHVQPYNDKVAKLYAEEALKELLSRIDNFPIKIGGMDCYFDKTIILNLINELK